MEATGKQTVAAAGPLAGVRVVEVAGIGPCPFAAMTLADLGAEVIRIDKADPGALDLPRDVDVLRRGRPSVALDLKSSLGRSTFLRLAERADIVIEGLRPGVAERLGIGPDDCMARNRALVYGRVTGWGQTGPRAQTAGHDLNYIALAGGLEPIGRAGGPPQFPLNLLGDFGGGALYLVIGVLAALTHARVSGEGEIVDAAIVDGVAHLQALTASMRNAGLWSDERGTNLLDSGAPFYDVYETADGRWLSLAALEPKFWAQFAQIMADSGVPEFPDRDDRHTWPELREQLRAAFVTRTRDEWTELFEGSDACVAPVLSLAEVAADPHLSNRQTWRESDGRLVPAPAPRFSASSAAPEASRPAEHADPVSVLSAWGIDNIDELLAAKVVVPQTSS